VTAGTAPSVRPGSVEAGSDPAGSAVRVVRRRVEHADTDAGGVVHFARYPVFAETAALDALHALGVDLAGLHRDGLDLAVADLRMRYAAPARFRDELTVGVRLAHLGAAQVRIDVEIRPDGPAGTPLATGTVVFAFVDRRSGRAVAVPAAVRDNLEEW
jgi:YbgC/YbaW family acyl-CoA thioester hydrolase